MPRKYQRKHKVFLPWVYKYYPIVPSGEADRIRLHNYRVLFLEAIVKVTPEVLRDLAFNIGPMYRQDLWNECSEPSETRSRVTVMWDNRFRYHKHMAESWCRGVPEGDEPDVWWRSYPSTRDLLLEWATKYRICTPWVLAMSLDALLEWEHSNSTLDIERSAMNDPVALAWPQSMILPQPQARNSEEKTKLEGYGPEPRVFEYLAWNGFDEKAYEAYIRTKFDRHLKEYMAEVLNRAARMRRVEMFPRPERFEMLALYLCRNMSPEEIGREAMGGTHKSAKAVYLDVRAAARLLLLSMKTKGRPRGAKRNSV